MPLFFWFEHFLEAKSEFRVKKSLDFFGRIEDTTIHFEISCSLIVVQVSSIFLVKSQRGYYKKKTSDIAFD